MPSDGLTQLTAEAEDASKAAQGRLPGRPTRTITAPTRTLPAVARTSEPAAESATPPVQAVEPTESQPRPAAKPPARRRPTYDRSSTTQLNLRVDSALADRLAAAVEALREAGVRKPTQYEVFEALLVELPTTKGPELTSLAERVLELRRTRI